MKIGILSDIHGNIEAMQTAMGAIEGCVDEVVVAGDAFSDHRFSNEVVGEIRRLGARYILGNHELSLLSHAGVNARNSPRVSAKELEFVIGQPTQIRTRIGSKELLIVHGSPWEPYGDYLSPQNPRFLRCDELGVDFVITGHTHHAFSRRFGHTLVVNPGSLGKSDDPDRRSSVTYSVLDTDSEEATVFEMHNPLLPSP